jgi:peptidylprolyl isomerase
MGQSPAAHGKNGPGLFFAARPPSRCASVATALQARLRERALPAHDHRDMLRSFSSVLALVLASLIAWSPAAVRAQQSPQTPAPAAGATEAAPPAAPRLPPVPADLAEPPADAEKTASGLVTKVLQPGTGQQKPGPGDLATFHYTGWNSQGKAFDSSILRRRPSTLFVDRLMPGMGEGLQLMVVGEIRRLWVPEALAFKGEKGKPEGQLVFDVELVGFEPSPRVPPLDVMAPPAEATKMQNGLAWRVLREGTGTVKPKKNSRVTVHYTGWTTDGQMFDSSVLRGQPATFGLDEVIRGWTLGVSDMVEGEKRRFWIPSRLAYDNEPGKPRGMLVFDVELVKIEKL